MNIIQLFLEDHRTLKDFLSQLRDIQKADTSALQQLMISFSKVLDRHTYEEETFFYPTVKQMNLRPEALEGFEEHRVVGQLLKEMKSLPLTDERWIAKFKVLRETLLHHLDEEERDLFPGAEKQIKQEDLLEMSKVALKSRS